MKRIPVLLAAVMLAAPAAAQNAAPVPPPLSLEQQMLLRCSAAFALVSAEQQRGVASAQAYPPLRERGREFFVRAGAKLMDELAWSREQLEAKLRTEVHALHSAATVSTDPAGSIASVMRPCLTVLDASGI